MLYTESMEMASPLLGAEIPLEAPSKVALSDAMRNRLAKPRVDLGLCMGSDTFVVCTEKGTVTHPARAAVFESNERLVALGAKALEIEGREPEGVVVKRPIQAGVVADPVLASKLMAQAIASAKHGLLSPPRVVLAVPAGLTAAESQTLLATAKKAGAKSVYLVDQGLAAALGAGRDLTKPEGHMVIHLGEGVTQVSLCSLASPVLSRGSKTAGESITNALMEHIRRHHNLLVDHKVARSVKHQLGSALPTIGDREMTIVGRELGIGKPVEKTITASEVYEVLRPYLEMIAQEARWVVAKMSPELLDDVHRNGVVLSGGGAELSRMDEYLSDQIRLRVRVCREPDSVVAKGLQRLLNDACLRKAVLIPGQKTILPNVQDRTNGTGLIGALMLTSALAVATHAAPLVGVGATASLEHYLGAIVTPASPMAEGWGWHPVDSALTSDLDERRRTQLEEENARLRELLKAPKKSAKALKYEKVLADVVSRDPRGWLSTLTLNVGSQDGVTQGMVVSDGQNLVGQISRVQKNRCQVRLFTDTNAVVAGTFKGKKASGVVVGSGEQQVEIRYLDPDAGVDKGDWILTSGHDGIFPPGLRLGQVQRVYQPPDKNYLAASIKPAVDFGNLENVVVIKG